MELTPPLWQFNGHLQTIIPSLFRKVLVAYQRERLELPDGDFIDLDWAVKGQRKLVIVSHGLEGDSTRHYVTGMIKAMATKGYDGLGWNCRSCSGEMNRLPRFYHHGEAEDLRAVIAHAIEKGYEEIVLVGFSLGGSLVLRAVAEHAERVPAAVKAVLAVSTPIDLTTTVHEMHKSGKRFYMERFIKKLGVKIELKSKTFPEHPHLRYDNYESRIKDFFDFDNTYTAPLHGYESALDYYERASLKPILKDIKVKTFLLQAINDPFLSKECLELGTAATNPNVTLILTQKGGHVGFMQRGREYTYAEQLALSIVA